MCEWIRRNRLVLWAMGGTVIVSLAVTTPLWVSGCDALNPSFVSMVSDVTSDESGQSAVVGTRTIDNARGHVPVMFVNNTTFSSQVLNYRFDWRRHFGSGSPSTDSHVRSCRVCQR